MTDGLSIQGTLAETTVPGLFRSVLRSGETAIVSLDAIGRNDSIYFNEGKIIDASSSDPDMGLGEVLLRSGELNLQQYDHAMERLVFSRRIGGILIDLGYLRPEELSRAAERQASAIVLDALAYRTGSYSIEFTAEFPDEIITLPLMTERLILEGVKRIEYWSLITRGLGRLSRVLQQVPGADTRSFLLELGDEESHVLSLLTEPATIEQICARSYLSNFVSCRTLWALMTVNLVEDSEAGVMDERRAAVENEYELEGLVENYNGVFQSIFGQVFQKIGDHIYDFTDRVLMHVARTRLPYLGGMSLVNEARIDFEQLLTNLIAAGSAQQGPIVHTLLNELLQGWIVEINKEFGGAMDGQIQALVEPLQR